jgi:hypothetical protein
VQLAKARGNESDKQIANIFSQLVLKGKLRRAVGWPSERERGGMLMPNNIDDEIWRAHHGPLHSKHPDDWIPAR